MRQAWTNVPGLIIIHTLSITSGSLFVYFDVINSSCLSERIRLQIILCLHFSLNPIAVVMDNFLAFALLLSVFTLSGNMKACDWLCKFHERDHAKECRDMCLLTSWNRNYFSPNASKKTFHSRKNPQNPVVKPKKNMLWNNSRKLDGIQCNIRSSFSIV